MLSYMIFGILTIGGLINIKNPRFTKWYSIILPGYIVVLSLFNTYNADYDVYYRIFYNKAWSSLEIGFEALTDIARFLHINYQCFFSIILSISFYLLYNGINALIKISDKKYVYFLYLLYPLMLDITQYRFFLATAIVVFCLKYLVSEDKGDIYKYLIGVIIASTIQITSLFYALFILYRIPHKKIVYKYSLLITFVLLFTLLTVNTDFIISFLSNLGNSKMAIYFDNHLNFGILIAFYYMLGSLASIYYIKKEMKLNNANVFINFVFELHLIILFTLPLVYFDFQFLRFWRSLSILKYCVYAVYINDKEIDLTKRKYFLIIILCYIFSIFLYEILYLRFENVFELILKNNWLLP